MGRLATIINSNIPSKLDPDGAGRGKYQTPLGKIMGHVLGSVTAFPPGYYYSVRHFPSCFRLARGSFC